MRAFTVRMVLSGLALSPALFLQLASPVQLGQLAKLAGGTPGIAMASAVIAFVPVLVAQLLPGKRKGPNSSEPHRAAGLLQDAELSRRLQTAPPDRVLNRALQAAIAPPRPHLRGNNPLGPDTQERVIANLLQTTLQQFGVASLDDSSREQKIELHALMQLLKATPQKAGDMARGFNNPEAVSRLRDLVETAARARQTFERQSVLFESARALWIMRRPGRSRGLLASLQSYALADPDLWHHVVTHCHLDDTAQHEAAHWCLAQPLCDQGTAAAYLRRVVLYGHLEDLAARARDSIEAAQALARVSSVLRRWRNGYYKTNEIAQLPISDQAKAEFDTRFQRAIELLGEDLPYPSGLFMPGGVRAPRARGNWSLSSGQMIGPPRAADYFEGVA